MHNGDKLNLHSNHGKRSEESPGLLTVGPTRQVLYIQCDQDKENN